MYYNYYKKEIVSMQQVHYHAQINVLSSNLFPHIISLYYKTITSLVLIVYVG